ncbi:MAG: S1 RNA-binding domain-containing protein, partial [Clostridia bacterium]|nr:S1 RNA-binding domain-containing protein [Clostridia bacterium]
MEQSKNDKIEEKFSLEAIERTFTNYKKGQMFDGVVVIKRENGCIFNIGGKNDAFLPAEEVDDYENLKIGDRFKVVIINSKNEDGMLEVSKSMADAQVIATQNANKLKLGSKFTFVVTSANSEGLFSKMGEYSIFVPAEEISVTTRDTRKA